MKTICIKSLCIVILFSSKCADREETHKPYHGAPSVVRRRAAAWRACYQPSSVPRTSSARYCRLHKYNNNASKQLSAIYMNVSKGLKPFIFLLLCNSLKIQKRSGTKYHRNNTVGMNVYIWHIPCSLVISFWSVAFSFLCVPQLFGVPLLGGLHTLPFRSVATSPVSNSRRLKQAFLNKTASQWHYEAIPTTAHVLIFPVLGGRSEGADLSTWSEHIKKL